MEKSIARIHEQSRVVRFTWVPSHTTPDDVVNSRLTLKQRLLNIGGDKLASRGKGSIAPPFSVSNAAIRRRNVMYEGAASHVGGYPRCSQAKRGHPN